MNLYLLQTFEECMRAPSSRIRKIAGLSAGPIAVLLAGAMVWQGSTAAFTANTRNDKNSWSTSQVTLTDNDQGQRAFEVNNMAPGASGERCITVTAKATSPSTVRLYGADWPNNGKNLAERIKLTFERGTGGSWADCTGFQPAGGYQTPAVSLYDFATVVTNFENASSFNAGGLSWGIPANSPVSAVYRISWTFDTTGMPQYMLNGLQGITTGASFVWDLRPNEPSS